MTDQTELVDEIRHEFRRGNRNRRNLYAGPGEEHHVAVTVGPIGHAAAMSQFLADAAAAYIAAGHPMPEPPIADEVFVAAFELVDKHQPDGRNHRGYDLCVCGWVAGGGAERWADHLTERLAADGLLADPEVRAERDQLKTCIDKANSIIATYRNMDAPVHVAPTIDWLGVLDDLRAALQGDQPTEPKPSRCPSCDHLTSIHDNGLGCLHTVTIGTIGRDLVCPCTADVPTEPAPDLERADDMPSHIAPPHGRCPNDPPCPHPAMIHDISGDPEDPKPMCCIDGCTCGQPDARTARSGSTAQGIPAESRSTVDSGEAVAKSVAYCGYATDEPPAPFVPAADAFPEVTDG